MLVVALAGGSVLLVGGIVLALVLSGVFTRKPTTAATTDKQAEAEPGAAPSTAKTTTASPKTDKATDSPEKSRDSSASAAALRKQLVGKWEGGDEKGKGSLELLDDGTAVLVMGGSPPVKGTYRVLDGETVEMRVSVGDQVVTQKLRVKVGKDELTTTDEMNKVDHFRRSTRAR